MFDAGRPSVFVLVQGVEDVFIAPGICSTYIMIPAAGVVLEACASSDSIADAGTVLETPPVASRGWAWMPHLTLTVEVHCSEKVRPRANI